MSGFSSCFIFRPLAHVHCIVCTLKYNCWSFLVCSGLILVLRDLRPHRQQSPCPAMGVCMFGVLLVRCMWPGMLVNKMGCAWLVNVRARRKAHLCRIRESTLVRLRSSSSSSLPLRRSAFIVIILCFLSFSVKSFAWMHGIVGGGAPSLFLSKEKAN